MRENSKKTTNTAVAKAPKTKITAKATSKTKTSSKKAPSKKTITPHKGVKQTRSRVLKSPPITPEERWKMISEAAYYIAEKQSFQDNNPEQDWRQAEAQIDALLVTQPKKFPAP